MRALEKLASTMKDMERWLGVTYRDSCQPSIMTETTPTLLSPELPTITPDTGIGRPKIDVDMTYLENKSIGEAIRQKLRKKDV